MIRNIFVFTGAGISAESGIQTFRDSNGDLVHEFYNKRRLELATVMPNAAHLAVAGWQYRYNTNILTQNIDDLFERAGCSNIVHLHGYLPQMHCEACGKTWHIGYVEWKADDVCPKCASKKGVKPDVVFFHQPAPLYQHLNKQINSLESADVMIVIGTSGTVVPIAEYIRGMPGTKILNNLEKSAAMDDTVFDHVFYAKAGDAVEEINKVLESLD
jgi:NAD-dependent deacetylase